MLLEGQAAAGEEEGAEEEEDAVAGVAALALGVLDKLVEEEEVEEVEEGVAVAGNVALVLGVLEEDAAVGEEQDAEEEEDAVAGVAALALVVRSQFAKDAEVEGEEVRSTSLKSEGSVSLGRSVETSSSEMVSKRLREPRSPLRRGRGANSVCVLAAIDLGMSSSRQRVVAGGETTDHDEPRVAKAARSLVASRTSARARLRATPGGGRT